MQELATPSLQEPTSSEAKGLETVVREAYSDVSVDMIYRSKGKIPEVFLRGCGIPDSFIADMRSLVAATEPIQFYSCFISYSHEANHGRRPDFRKDILPAVGTTATSAVLPTQVRPSTPSWKSFPVLLQPCLLSRRKPCAKMVPSVPATTLECDTSARTTMPERFLPRLRRKLVLIRRAKT